jgi:hypothetical protein
MVEVGFNLKENLPDVLKNQRPVDSRYILQLLRNNISIYWSWGVRGLTDLSGKGLRMTVSGFKHKGHVYVFLNGGDLFDVVLTTNRGIVKKVIKDIYFDDLLNQVDDAIEYTGDDYEDRVNKSVVKL